MVCLKKESKFSLIYPKITRNLNILRDFLILVIRAPYISNKGPDFNNKVLDLLRNCKVLKNGY